MKAKEIIEFLQAHPDADVQLDVGPGYSSASSLEYESPEEMTEAAKSVYPDGIIYIGENKEF